MPKSIDQLLEESRARLDRLTAGRRDHQELGLHRATDVIGGFDSWRDAGLPIEPCRET